MLHSYYKSKLHSLDSDEIYVQNDSNVFKYWDILKSLIFHLGQMNNLMVSCVSVLVHIGVIGKIHFWNQDSSLLGGAINSQNTV